MNWRLGIIAFVASCASIEGTPPEPPPIPSEAQLVIPSVISLPYVTINQNSTLSITVQNIGDKPFDSLSWSLVGDPSLSLISAPTSLEGNSTATLAFLFTGSSQEHIANAELRVNELASQVFAVAGDNNLGASIWETLSGPNQEFFGEGTTLSMPTAPYPDADSSFTDSSVRIFVPEGYRDRGAQDVIIHFHGHSTTLAATLAAHKYQQHVYTSGVNALLVVPQGPLNAASGDFGKLMTPANTEAFLQQVLVALYREEKIASPRLGDVVLTSHSGGYQAVAANINNGGRFFVSQVNLFDSLYGFSSTYQSFAQNGGLLRSNYTTSGGTLANNQALADTLSGLGVTVSEEVTTNSLRDDTALIYFANTSHGAATRLENAYSEQLRWGMAHSRRGPRIELRSAVASNGSASLQWLSPIDEDLLSFLVEVSNDGIEWSVAAEVPATQLSADIALSGASHLRVIPVVEGVEAPLPSNEIFLDPQGDTLVVDGFDRRVDGSFAGLSHNFSATVGRAARASGYASHVALVEDGFALDNFASIVWLSGDESTSDTSISDDEQAILGSYLQDGGKLLLSGSELAFSLNQSAFLLNTMGASLQSDDSNSFIVNGDGALTGLPSFSYSDESAPYQEDFPDALLPQSTAEVLLRYGNGQGAAIGRNNQTILVGFPLELIAEEDLSAVIDSLLSYLN